MVSNNVQQPTIEAQTSVSEALQWLGEPRPKHHIAGLNTEMIKRGEELVKIGRTTGPDNKRTPYISKFYTCTSCHNTVREDKNLTKVNPDERLSYAMETHIPYLQGSTFWGIVNREHWYNDDYIEKYGDLVAKAQENLAASVNLCATVCAQGRELKEWELNSIIAYFWSLEMKIADLDLSEKELLMLNTTTSENAEKVALIKSKYLQKSPATFADPPSSKKEGYPHTGEPDLGKAIYQLGCQHCHRPEGESDVVFDNSGLTFRWLKRHLTSNSDKSIYEIIRHGTYAAYGHRAYMPNYTLEKMSDQQVEHLRSYIEAAIN